MNEYTAVITAPEAHVIRAGSLSEALAIAQRLARKHYQRASVSIDVQQPDGITVRVSAEVA